MKYVWICKGCFVASGIKPDYVSESCVGGRSGKQICKACGAIQDYSWFKHVVVAGLPDDIKEKLNDMA